MNMSFRLLLLKMALIMLIQYYFLQNLIVLKTNLKENLKITFSEMQRSSISANNEFFYQANIESTTLSDGVYNFTTYAQAKLA